MLAAFDMLTVLSAFYLIHQIFDIRNQARGKQE